MNEEATDNNGDEERWYIDMDWYQENRRSFSALAQPCLCAKCRKKLKADEGEVAPNKLLSAIKDCCSKQSGFITTDLPVTESIFRALLAGGNEPVEIVELGERLKGWRGGSSGSASRTILSRLLMHDQYYGFTRYQG
ncbi:hypothetical protein ACFLYQ_00935 [Chloroflexota bacterium]